MLEPGPGGGCQDWGAESRVRRPLLCATSLTKPLSRSLSRLPHTSSETLRRWGPYHIRAHCSSASGTAAGPQGGDHLCACRAAPWLSRSEAFYA